MSEKFFFSVPLLGWIAEDGFEYEKVGWNKARPVHGTHNLETVILRFSPFALVKVVPTQTRKLIVHFQDGESLVDVEALKKGMML